ncbi:MAG TPA: DNA/RNA non-specific endonuclease [Noviherbaspirillum sp.]|nr:DNA/RNA non-specific endonuclease [Noviherbaspirillum sp.]
MRKTKDTTERYIELPATTLRTASVLQSQKMRDALATAAHERELTTHRTLGFSADVLADHLSTTPPDTDAEFFDSRQISEAIVLLAGRPVLLVKDGVFEKANLPLLEKRLSSRRKALIDPIRAVGRVELSDHDTYEWCGTGWRIDDDLVVTNRHVANLFAQRQGRVFRYRLNRAGRQIRARIDFREEYRGVESSEIGVAEILWIADDTAEAPDMAILRVRKDPGLPPPLKLYNKPIQPEQFIAVVGYPARDSRNDAGAMREIFGDVYDVKRFAPGEVVAVPKDEWYFTHDSSTLGGNSGSAAMDVESGAVVGLHFGGQFRKTNYAVKASVIKSMLVRKSWVPVTRTELHVPEEGFSEKKRSIAYLKEREGYDARFLGATVNLPKAGRSHLVLDTEFEANVLPYMHFSVVMSESRRFPLLTAVNIDGELKKKLKRKDAWGFDPRIPKQQQIGHVEFYGPAVFDKGHMVRREDPGWGESLEEAMLGEEDSFIYTNAVPQMPQLNQRAWLLLEDYVLENAKTYGFRISVFTGPVFRADDPHYESVQVPLDFWKVVAMIDADTQELCVSAYMLSQEGMMPEEGFRYGPFKTYQVPLQKIADAADLRFSKAMMDADVLSADTTEILSSARFVEIISAQDIVLTRSRGRRK